MKKGIQVELYSGNPQDLDEFESMVRDYIERKMCEKKITSFKIERVASFMV